MRVAATQTSRGALVSSNPSPKCLPLASQPWAHAFPAQPLSLPCALLPTCPCPTSLEANTKAAGSPQPVATATSAALPVQHHASCAHTPFCLLATRFPNPPPRTLPSPLCSHTVAEPPLLAACALHPCTLARSAPPFLPSHSQAHAYWLLQTALNSRSMSCAGSGRSVVNNGALMSWKKYDGRKGGCLV